MIKHRITITFLYEWRNPDWINVTWQITIGIQWCKSSAYRVQVVQAFSTFSRFSRAN